MLCSFNDLFQLTHSHILYVIRNSKEGMVQKKLEERKNAHSLAQQ